MNRSPRWLPLDGDPTRGQATRFVVTGCARSGTTYASRLLTACGVLCSHEHVFRNRTRDGGTSIADDGRQVGDSSCFAAPVLPRPMLVVVHLLRAPLDAIASLIARNLLSQNAFRMMAQQWVPEVAQYPPGGPREAAYWLGWNRLAARHADLTWWLGRITPADVMQLSQAAGLGLDADQVATALESTPINVNAGTRRHITMDDLGELAAPIARAAEQYQLPLTTFGDTHGPHGAEP